MPTTSFSVINSDSAFVTALRIDAPDSQIHDADIWTCRSILAKQWQPIRCRIEANKGGFIVYFERPDNSRHFRVDIHHARLGQLAAMFIRIEPLDETTIRHRLHNQSITFLGCARQCSNALPETLAKIRQLGGLFNEYHICVFENDSTDTTRQILQQYREIMPLKLITRDGLDSQLPGRTTRLAFARNLLLDLSRTIGSHYVCWVDMDGLINNDYPSEQSFLSCFKYESCWDGVFPVNNGSYYDVWALRHPQICPQDYMRKAENFDALFDIQVAYGLAFGNATLLGHVLSGWLPVDSAFGGMGIYKLSELGMARYYGSSEENEICEHVLFHQTLKTQGKALYINPEFLIATHPAKPA